MTEGFRSPPPAGPGGWVDTAAGRRQEVTDTVQRIMGEDIAPPARPVTTPPPPAQNGDGSTTDVAKQQTAEVADTAERAGAQVVDTVKEQAGQVTEEAKHQAKQLLSQAQSELSEQAASTQHRVSEGLFALADELSGMARNSEQDGVATDLARQAADRARTAAGWLADRDPGSLLDEVRSFARRKPGTYLALALGAGVLAGRLTRGLTAPTTDDTPDPSRSVTAPPNQVGTGQQALTSAPLPATATRYGDDTDPVTDPPSPVSPTLTGLGTAGTFAGPRGDLAP